MKKRLPALGFGLPDHSRQRIGDAFLIVTPPEAESRKPGALLDAELFSGVGAEAFGGPGRSPHHVHRAVADAG